MDEDVWLFNTDETEQEGEGAWEDMLAQSVIAAWGDCRGTGAQGTLNRPANGETVLFFRARHGIIARGQVEGQAFQANTIFGQPDEYHRTVANLQILPNPLPVAVIRENTGYILPCRHIVCRLADEVGVQFILDHCENVHVV